MNESNNEDFYNYWKPIHNRGLFRHILGSVGILTVFLLVIVGADIAIEKISIASSKLKSIVIMLLLFLAASIYGAYSKWQSNEKRYSEIEKVKNETIDKWGNSNGKMS